MERVEQMKRDIVIVAVIVPLLLAAWVLAGPEKALAQSVSSDQYSSAATEQYVDGGDQQVPVGPADPAYPGLADTPDPSHTPPGGSSQVPVGPADPAYPGLANEEPTQVEPTTQADPSGQPVGPSDPTTPSSDDPAERPGNPPDTGTSDTADDDVEGVVEEGSGSIIDRLSSVLGSLAGLLGAESPQQQAQQPEQVLQQMPQATPAPEAAQPLEADMGSSTDQMTNLLGQDIDPFWTERFQGWAPYNSPNQVWYDERTQTPCGEIKPEEAGVGNGHNYCSENETIYMSIPAAQTYAAKWGNFANVYQLAHEQGHHVQNELGYFAKYKNDSIPGNSRAFENQADCFAGVWANSAYGQSKIGEQQIQEAIAAAEGLEDDRTIEQGATHGNAAERTGWLLKGFNSGDPAVCAT